MEGKAGGAPWFEAISQEVIAYDAGLHVLLCLYFIFFLDQITSTGVETRGQTHGLMGGMFRFFIFDGKLQANQQGLHSKTISIK